MSPLIVAVLAQVLDVLIGALTKHPEFEPHLGPLIATILPALSQAAGETAEQTAARRTAAEAIFAKYAQPIVAPPPVTP
jgi:hypothetical protein